MYLWRGVSFYLQVGFMINIYTFQTVTLWDVTTDSSSIGKGMVCLQQDIMISVVAHDTMLTQPSEDQIRRRDILSSDKQDRCITQAIMS